MARFGLAQRFRILQRDDFTCQYCGAKAPAEHLEIDHIVARANGGHDGASNLVTACFNCNRGKRDSVLAPEHVARVSKGALPAKQPTRRIYASPVKTFTEDEPRYRVCPTCRGRIWYERDSECSCRRVELRECEFCNEELEDEDEELCRPCYNNLYVYCWDCGENEQVEPSNYCDECTGSHPRFLGGVS